MPARVVEARRCAAWHMGQLTLVVEGPVVVGAGEALCPPAFEVVMARVWFASLMALLALASGVALRRRRSAAA